MRSVNTSNNVSKIRSILEKIAIENQKSGKPIENLEIPVLEGIQEIFNVTREPEYGAEETYSEKRKRQNESHVLEFIHENQIDKRNVTAYERGEHAIAAYKIREEREAKERQGWKNSQNLSTSEYKGSVNHLPPNLGERKNEKDREKEVGKILAKRANVAHGTMHKITKIVDFAEEADKPAQFRKSKRSK